MTPYVDEFVRQVRLDDADATVVVAPDGEATVVWSDSGAESPITAVTTERDLAQAVRDIGTSCHELWPSATVDEAGFNLLFVHLEEVIVTRDTSRPLRIVSTGLLWPDRRRDD